MFGIIKEEGSAEGVVVPLMLMLFSTARQLCSAIVGIAVQSFKASLLGPRGGQPSKGSLAAM